MAVAEFKIDLDGVNKQMAKYCRESAKALLEAADKVDPPVAGLDGDTDDELEGRSAADWKHLRDVWFRCWRMASDKCARLEVELRVARAQTAPVGLSDAARAALSSLQACASSCRFCAALGASADVTTRVTTVLEG